MKLAEASILVLDDEPDLVDIFGNWLTAAGYQHVYTAENGQGALAVINSTAIDLLVTDLRMALMDGITLVRQIVAPACLSWLLEHIATANPLNFISSLL